MVTWQFFKSDYRRWWSLSVKRNIRQFDYNYSLFVDIQLFLLYFNIFFHVVVLHFRRLFIIFACLHRIANTFSDPTSCRFIRWLLFQTFIYIRLKITPNSVRIRFLSCQIFVLPSTGFDLTPLIHCSTNRLALCPAP
jgi:hypothetical protein